MQENTGFIWTVHSTDAHVPNLGHLLPITAWFGLQLSRHKAAGSGRALSQAPLLSCTVQGPPASTHELAKPTQNVVKTRDGAHLAEHGVLVVQRVEVRAGGDVELRCIKVLAAACQSPFSVLSQLAVASSCCRWS